MGVGLQNRSSVMAVTKEVAEGSPKLPTLAKEFIALQTGFTLTPQFEELQSQELQAGSIGRSKSVLGNENPTSSFSHYIRHSGVEGQAPNYAPLIEALLGKETIATTEYQTAGASTVLIIKVPLGQGIFFRPGRALLIKDSFGYSIRNILKVVGDDLYLAQKLLNAPTAGVKLGKACTYEPATEDHPTLTIWNYRANGGAIEAMSGSRVVDLTINVNAGQQINGAFSLAGNEYFFNCLNVPAGKTYLDFLDETTERAVSIAPKLYKDPHQLAEAFEVAMNALGSASTFKVAYNDNNGKYSFESSGAIFEMLLNTGANSSNCALEVLGFDLSSDKQGDTSYESENPILLASPVVPSYDSAQPLVAKGNEVMLGGIGSIECFGAQSANMKVANTKADIPDLCEDSGKSGSIFSERNGTVDVVAILKKHDADKFTRFRKGDNTSFTFNAGEKVGGNWKPGTCFNFHIPTATIVNFSITEANGLCVLNMTLRAYVEDGKPEVFINYV